ncbi:hypothetical protein PDESU_02447 [Pontiella desulfatans]|uniref:Uncharacterized protein n=1 Tax=Pontiella desulfatans TaxID=2750659 RepID=A0A6C2U1N7_PONDE|nr:hypothetical protein PDESU_02447 [Pontiella desulfatans]
MGRDCHPHQMLGMRRCLDTIQKKSIQTNRVFHTPVLHMHRINRIRVRYLTARQMTYPINILNIRRTIKIGIPINIIGGLAGKSRRIFRT